MIHLCRRVTLDGSNPTPVDVATLSGGVIGQVQGAVACFEGTGALGVDPTAVTVVAAAGVLNLYAWKVTSADDAELIASTDNARSVAFMGWGTKS